MYVVRKSYIGYADPQDDAASSPEKLTFQLKRHHTLLYFYLRPAFSGLRVQQ